MTTASLPNSGERMLPEFSDGRTFWEHVQRYRFAAARVRGQRVLDIACGEGYGAAGMTAAGAEQVIGVDVSEEACAHARAKYGVDARTGDATAIPLDDGEVDTVVSFETIEHLHEPATFLEECARVLSTQGTLIISTPNRPVYRVRSPKNPFHHHEMTVLEFQTALSLRFTDIKLYGQYVPASPFWQRRVMRRLPYMYQQVFAPHALRPPTEQERSAVTQLINQPPCWRDTLDPYRVCSMTKHRVRNACYLIAVATKR